jgi:hypothetical protein
MVDPLCIGATRRYPDVTASAASPSLLLFPQVPGLHSGGHGRRHASVERSDDPLPDGLYGVTRCAPGSRSAAVWL